MTSMEFRAALKSLYRQFPRPKKYQETVGDWAWRLFEHQFEMSRLISQYFGSEFADPDDSVPAKIEVDSGCPVWPQEEIIQALNWLLDLERRRRS